MVRAVRAEPPPPWCSRGPSEAHGHVVRPPSPWARPVLMGLVPALLLCLMWALVSAVAKTVLLRAAVVVQPRTDVTGFVFRTGTHPPPGHRLFGGMPTPGRRQRESR